MSFLGLDPAKMTTWFPALAQSPRLPYGGAGLLLLVGLACGIQKIPLALVGVLLPYILWYQAHSDWESRK